MPDPKIHTNKQFLVVLEDLEEAEGYKQNLTPDHFWIVTASSPNEAILAAKREFEKTSSLDIDVLTWDWREPSRPEDKWYTFYTQEDKDGEVVAMFYARELETIPHLPW